jgi:Putative glucoamylase
MKFSPISNGYASREQDSHTMINRAYCLDKAPKDQGYSEKLWGLTSSDEPNGYSDHHPVRDNGTLAPTAALSAFAYTPYYSLQVLKGLYEEKSKTYGDYGFYDAINKKQNWYSTQYISIDQGPIVVMMENYRSELIWKLFMGVSEVKTALSKMNIGTPKYKTGFYLAIPDAKTKNYDVMKHPDLNGYPIDVFMEQADSKATLELLDANSKSVLAIPFDGKFGASKVIFNMTAGVYTLSMKSNGVEYKLNVQLR